MIKKQDYSPDKISIAPMLDYTDPFFRTFFRKIFHKCMLYTEMIPTGAILYGDQNKYLSNTPEEQPITLQLGGNNPKELAECAYRAQESGFKAINLNAGCPSSRVQSGNFGACLMKTPLLIADCIYEIRKKIHIPVSVKTRLSFIGEDNFEKSSFLTQTLESAGCQHIIFHARQVALSKSPKENRSTLPLDYQTVYLLKKKYPHIFISINGNIKSKEEINTHLEKTDGVMIGRWPYGNPYACYDFDATYFCDFHAILSRIEILEQMIPFLEQAPSFLVAAKSMMGLFYGTPYSKGYKQILMSKDISQLKKFIKNFPTDEL